MDVLLHQFIYRHVCVNLKTEKKGGGTRHWTPQNASDLSSLPWLYTKQVCCLCCVKGTYCMGTYACSPASISLFPMIHSNTLPITTTQISVLVICLFITAICTVQQSSLAVVCLEGLLVTLFWFHICTTVFTVIALQPALWAIWLYNAPMSLMPVMQPFSMSDRWW